MKKSKFTEEQIAFALREVEDENARLKRLVAGLSLDKHIFTEACEKETEARPAPRANRLGVCHLHGQSPAGLRVGAVQSSGVVPAIDPGRASRAAVAHSGVGARAAAVRLHADLGPAATRGMAGE